MFYSQLTKFLNTYQTALLSLHMLTSAGHLWEYLKNMDRGTI